MARYCTTSYSPATEHCWEGPRLRPFISPNSGKFSLNNCLNAMRWLTQIIDHLPLTRSKVGELASPDFPPMEACLAWVEDSVLMLCRR